MLTKLRLWFRNRHAARQRALYERGFGAVMTEHYLHGKSAQDIDDNFYNPYDPNEFDAGAGEALRLLTRKGGT